MQGIEPRFSATIVKHVTIVPLPIHLNAIDNFLEMKKKFGIKIDVCHLSDVGCFVERILLLF